MITISGMSANKSNPAAGSRARAGSSSGVATRSFHVVAILLLFALFLCQSAFSTESIPNEIATAGAVADDDWPITEDCEAVEGIQADDRAVFVPGFFEEPRPEADRTIPIPQSPPSAIASAATAQMPQNPWFKTEKPSERTFNISGTKTFEMKKAEVKGDVGHFSTDNYRSIPGFRLDQSLRLEIDGKIGENARVMAVLDDKEDEDRRFTVNIDEPVWGVTMGDFPLFLEDTEFALHRKEVRGILVRGAFRPGFNSIFMFSQSKGAARREQFRGAGNQQEFRLPARPVVINSERVFVDGKLLTRGTDYLVDYEDGLLKLQPHLLPIEITRWIVVEYEVSGKKLNFKRNLFGTRQVYTRSENRQLGLTWLREVDAKTPKSQHDSTAIARPIQHDLLGFDAAWRISPALVLKGESSTSIYDPNTAEDATAQDKAFSGHAGKLTLSAETDRFSGDFGIRRVDDKFRIIGREDGAVQLGERGMVGDILKSDARMKFRLKNEIDLFSDFEKSKTNLSEDPTRPRIDFSDLLGGFTWRYADRSRLEMRYGFQTDKEAREAVISDRDRAVGAVVWDHQFGKLYTQTKVEHTRYDDVLNTASGSNVLQTDLTFGSDYRDILTWSMALSRVALDDELVKDDLRSEIYNYTLDMNYEPNRMIQARGIFQFRREEDFLVNSRQNTNISDSRFRYQPNDDLVSQFKYKVENTSKIIRDPNLDPTLFVRPPSLPLQQFDREEIVGRFENPVQMTSANFTTNYNISHNLEAYLDWRWRDLEDRSAKKTLNTNDRKTWELRYTPINKLQLITEYEYGLAENFENRSELRDDLKRVQVRSEFLEGYILDFRFEEQDENDKYDELNNRFSTRKAADFQRILSRRTTVELGVARNVTRSTRPFKEWEQKAAVIITPSARNQRYRFFLASKDVESEVSGTHLEGGVIFSQFIGTDTIIDGELKKVRSTGGINGTGYEAFIANAKMIITF